MYQKIIFCNCNGEAIKEEFKNKAVELLSHINAEKIILNDLCGICATDKEALHKSLNSEGKILIIACYTRAVKLLVEYGGQKDLNQLSFLSLRDDEAENTLEVLKNLASANYNDIAIREIKSKAEWPAWYPVLDYAKCTACGQCADFCLFGVYSKQNGKVEVVNPEACKINCPACARICPQIAIVFPKYVHGGAIGGSEKIDVQEEQKRQLADMENILGDDIYKALEMRKAKRKSIISTDALKKAQEERDKALKENLN
jgi:Pyruvate/2-oxoacid:ferredoxin oxidoreductase delta subunit